MYTLITGLLLSLLLRTWLGISVPVYVLQTETPTPTPTDTPTPTATASYYTATPPAGTPQPTVGDFITPAYAGNEDWACGDYIEGLGTLTPSAGWLMACGWCLDNSMYGVGEYTPTPTPAQPGIETCVDGVTWYDMYFNYDDYSDIVQLYYGTGCVTGLYYGEYVPYTGYIGYLFTWANCWQTVDNSELYLQVYPDTHDITGIMWRIAVSDVVPDADPDYNNWSIKHDGETLASDVFSSDFDGWSIATHTVPSGGNPIELYVVCEGDECDITSTRLKLELSEACNTPTPSPTVDPLTPTAYTTATPGIAGDGYCENIEQEDEPIANWEGDGMFGGRLLYLFSPQCFTMPQIGSLAQLLAGETIDFTICIYPALLGSVRVFGVTIPLQVLFYGFFGMTMWRWWRQA